MDNSDINSMETQQANEIDIINNELKDGVERVEKRGRKKGDIKGEFCKLRYKLGQYNYKNNEWQELNKFSTLAQIADFLGLEYNTINYIYKCKNKTLCKLFKVEDYKE